MSINPDSSICLARWEAPSIHLHTGKVKTCCRTTLVDVDFEETTVAEDLFNNKYFKARREEMVQGLRDPSCSYCWELEKQDMKTPREGLDRFLSYREKNYGEDSAQLRQQLSDKSYHPELLLAHKPTTLEISIGNVCDLKCLYCSPEFSTSWALEDEKFTEFKRPPKRDDVELKFIEIYFWQWLEGVGIHSLKEICLIGGEPLLILSVDQMILRISQLAKQRPPEMPRLKLAITSNFNSSPARFKKFMEVVNTASDVIDIELRASIESYGERAEYIRSGLKWDHMKNNLATACQTSAAHVIVAIAATHNALSLSSFPDLIDFVRELMLKTSKFVIVHFNLVMFPTWIGVDVVPSSFSGYVLQAVEKMRLIANGFSNDNQKKSWLQSTNLLLDMAAQIEKNNPTTERVADFRKHIELYEKRRNTDFLKTFPEFSELLILSKEKLNLELEHYSETISR